MATKFSLNGSMIPRQVRRMFDQRSEPRFETGANTAVLAFRGDSHVVRICNQSPSGVMIVFGDVPNIGERVSLQLMEHGTVQAQVRWIRDGRIGLAFARSLG